ncbi:MAG: hypothetical protein HY072_06515 [Deltaproteobacteria bacterium]|nr:hypothetical protein [Deltaproteobacteria bacterium]
MKSAWLVLSISLVVPVQARAVLHSVPPSLSEEVLTESVPFVFPPNDFEAIDYKIEWLGQALEDVSVTLATGSLQWVRTIDVLLLPRGRLVVKAKNIESGKLFNKGFHQAFSIASGEGQAELPVALISGEQNPIRIFIKRHGKDFSGTVIVRFEPKREFSESPLVFTDHSCSPYQVRLVSGGSGKNQWVYVGCRLVHVYGEEHRISSLEMFVFWDNLNQKVFVDNVETEASSTSLWALRQRASPGTVTIRSGDNEIKLEYRISDRIRLSTWGMGIGPYLYTFESNEKNAQGAIVPYLTLYQSFFITESMRVVGFGAVPIHSAFYADLGVYLNSESIKVLDRRFIMNIMLGAHVNVFKIEGKTNFIFGGPQGAEIIFKDLFKKGYNFNAGAFVYPPISGKLYYNVWMRWGSARFFTEFNYIAWQEKLSDINPRIYSKSIGISIGFPLFRIF